MANVTKETIFAQRHQMHFILHPIHVTNERGRMEKGFDYSRQPWPSISKANEASLESDGL